MDDAGDWAHKDWQVRLIHTRKDKLQVADSLAKMWHHQDSSSFIIFECPPTNIIVEENDETVMS